MNERSGLSPDDLIYLSFIDRFIELTYHESLALSAQLTKFFSKFAIIQPLPQYNFKTFPSHRLLYWIKRS